MLFPLPPTRKELARRAYWSVVSWTLLLSPAILTLLLVVILPVSLRAYNTLFDLAAQDRQPVLLSPKPYGDITVGFGLIEDETLRNKAADLGNQAEEILTNKYGRPWHSWSLVLWEDPNLENGGEFHPELCQQGTSYGSIVVKQLTQLENLGVYSHELAHAFHGCFFLPDDRFEEGVAEAVSQIILQQLQLPPYLEAYDKESYQNINRAGIGGGKELARNSTGSIGSLRYSLAGSAFRLFEDDHPGFLKKFNEAFYGKLYEGKKLEEIDPVAVGEEVQPGFADWFAAQHIFDPRPKGNQILTLGEHNSVYVYAVLRNDDGKELPWIWLDLTISVQQNGQEIAQMTGRTDETGFYRLVLTDLKNPPSLGTPVTIGVEGGGLTDKFTFTPQ